MYGSAEALSSAYFSSAAFAPPKAAITTPICVPPNPSAHSPPPTTFSMAAFRSVLRLLSVLCAVLSTSASPTLTLYNRCSHTVWPGIQPSAGHPILASGGLELLPNQARSIPFPTAWSGRVWPRVGCNFDASGRGRCATGDCAAGLHCSGNGGAPPATLAELTLGPNQDFYDISLVDGFNLGMAITPLRKGAACASAGCARDLNGVCPAGLAVKSGSDGRVVGCKSACFAFRSDRFCCTGKFGSPQECKPTAYSRLFKEACPRAYSYAYDDPTSILTCSGASYLVTFCPRS